MGDHALVVAAVADAPQFGELALTLGSVLSTEPGVGDDDTIFSGDGADIVLGGWGADYVDAGAGADLVLGDNGSLDFVIDDGDAADLDRVTSRRRARAAPT